VALPVPWREHGYRPGRTAGAVTGAGTRTGCGAAAVAKMGRCQRGGASGSGEDVVATPGRGGMLRTGAILAFAATGDRRGCWLFQGCVEGLVDDRLLDGHWRSGRLLQRREFGFVLHHALHCPGRCALLRAWRESASCDAAAVPSPSRVWCAARDRVGFGLRPVACGAFFPGRGWQFHPRPPRLG
jgi:hypothetical protein